MILQCKITKVVERPGVHYRGRHSPWISSDRDGSFLFGSTPARIFDLLSFSSHEPRSVNSRFDWSKRRKQGLCARTHTGYTVITCWSDFFYFSLSLVDHFYFLYCFVSGVENALSIANLQRTIFDSHCVGILFYTAIALLSISYASIFSIFAYQEPLFFFLFSTKGGFSMCVSVTIYLSSKGGRCWGFESRGGGTD